MAAKLEWKERTPFSGCLVLGGWMIAAVWRESTKGRQQFHYELHNEDCTHGGPYQESDDAFQDCESEVRRLLKTAGVEVE